MAAVVTLAEVKAYSASAPALPAKVSLYDVKAVGGGVVTTVRLYDVRAVGGAVARSAQVSLYDVRAIGGAAARAARVSLYDVKAVGGPPPPPPGLFMRVNGAWQERTLLRRSGGAWV